MDGSLTSRLGSVICDSENLEDMLQYVLASQTPEEASEKMLRYARKAAQKYDQPLYVAEDILRDNLGYMSGYHSIEIAQKLYDLTKITHPIFGSPEARSQLTTEQIFALGVKGGEEGRK